MELNNLYCLDENHNNSKILGFCIDENCQAQNRFACAECFFDIHPQHKLLRIKELNHLINNRYKDYKNYLEEEKVLKKNESKQLQKLEEFKKKLIKEIEIKINNFICDLKKEYENMPLNQHKNDFVNIKEFERVFNNNPAPKKKSELSNLSKVCLYKIKEENNNKKEIDKPSDNQKALLKSNYILDNYNKELDHFSKNLKEDILKVFDNNFRNFNFEWCEKTYGGYEFLYKLSNNNQKGTKIKSNGTMSVLRSKEELKNNYK